MAHLDPVAERRHRRRNRAQAALLVLGMVVILGLVALFVLGPAGLLWVAVVGVLAHEVAHVRANDLWIMHLSDLVARTIQALTWIGLVLLLGAVPLAATTPWPLVLALALGSLPTVTALLQLAVARSREYDADLTAAAITGDPAALATALQRLDGPFPG